MLKANFWIPSPKKYKGANFHEDWPNGTQVMTISSDTENSKWQISEKKDPKITQISKTDISGTI